MYYVKCMMGQIKTFLRLLMKILIVFCLFKFTVNLKTRGHEVALVKNSETGYKKVNCFSQRSTNESKKLYIDYKCLQCEHF